MNILTRLLFSRVGSSSYIGFKESSIAIHIIIQGDFVLKKINIVQKNDNSVAITKISTRIIEGLTNV